MNILIIDDDSEDTEIFCAALSEILPRAVCTVSNSCLKVHELINALPFQHFIFLDGHMTPVNGRQCLIELMRIINPLETKVIIYTGRISDEETKEFLDLDVTEVIWKANGFEELKALLKRVLK